MPSAVLPSLFPEHIQRRAWGYVRRCHPTACWPWLASPNSSGYGQLGWNEDGKRRNTTSHRVIWHSVNGSIPPGMTVDHRCKNILCQNPAHLRLLTNEVNAADNRQAQRGMGLITYKEAA